MERASRSAVSIRSRLRPIDGAAVSVPTLVGDVPIEREMHKKTIRRHTHGLGRGAGNEGNECSAR